jgi:hypothetical protein
MNELDTDTSKVLLPLIRRVVPNILANDIIRGQFTISSLYGMHSNDIGLRIGQIKMNKLHYHHFLRLPNRKKYYKIADISNIYKYPSVKVSAINASDARRWCETNLKVGSFVLINNHFCFAYEQDASWFGLVWD